MAEEIEKILLEISERDLIDASVVNSATPAAGQGYLSDIKIINVQGKTKSNQNHTISFVIKIAAKNKTLREASASAEVFSREIYMYEKVFPTFYQFENEKGILHPFSSTPKFYKAIKNVIPEILILENLKQNGYENWNPKIQMEHDHVEAVLKVYGRFHAVSFAIRDQKPQVFQELTKNLDNVLRKFLKISGLFDTFVYKTKRLLDLLDPQENAIIFKRYKIFVDGLEEKFEHLISANDDFHAILHGDCWSNNMLFKHKESNEEQLSEIRLIDFQLAKLGSPVLDLAYFFYVCTSEKVMENVNEYKRIYYNSFSERLRLLGSNSDVLYPYSVFDKHWKEYAVYGLIISSLVRETLLRQENEIKSLADIVEAGGNIGKAFEDCIIANASEYKTRMIRMVEHFVENNYI